MCWLIGMKVSFAAGYYGPGPCKGPSLSMKSWPAAPSQFCLPLLLLCAAALALPLAAGEHPISRDLAVAVTFLDRTINFWSIVVFGFILYLFSKRK